MGGVTPVAEEALRWIKRGGFPIPVEYGGKRPIGAGWEQQRLTAASIPEVFNGTPLNLGVLWGECSNGLVDVDLDWPEAASIAASLLSRTAAYDRPGAPDSHRIYRTAGARTRRWDLPAALVPDGFRMTVLELRADGAQSVVSPSVHPSGERYSWCRQAKPCELSYGHLLQRLNLVAAGALLCRSWKEGSRHQLKRIGELDQDIARIERQMGNWQKDEAACRGL